MRTLETLIKLTPTRVASLRQCGFQPLWLRDHPEHRRAFTETPASARGKALHAALAEFHRMGGAETYTPTDLNALLRFYWPSEGFTDAEEERLAQLQCEADLKQYYARCGRTSGTLAVERSWTLLRDLDGRRTEWAGRMDWVRELPGGGLEIVDWKTGGRPATAEILAADPVTILYARLGRDMARRQFSWAGREIRFAHVYLGSGEKLSVQITREMVEAAEAELSRLARGLESGDLPPAEGPWCQWGCPVKAAGACPLFPPAALDGEWE